MSVEIDHRSENYIANPSRRRLLKRGAALGVTLLGASSVVAGTADIFSTIQEAERLGREAEAKSPLPSSETFYEEADLNTRASFDIGAIFAGLGTAGIGALAYTAVGREGTTTTSE